MEKKISLEVTQKTRVFLAQTGYDPLHGAWP
jgi:ATP-dependent Clp protease ATP-binding subunit ClpA